MMWPLKPLSNVTPKSPVWEQLYSLLTAAWLAQLGERRSAEREVAGSNPGRTNTQGL